MIDPIDNQGVYVFEHNGSSTDISIWFVLTYTILSELLSANGERVKSITLQYPLRSIDLDSYAYA